MTELIRPKHRLEMLKLFPQGGIVAELGAFRGEFSEQMYRKLRPSILYLVDRWDSDMRWTENGQPIVVTGEQARLSSIAKFRHFPNVVLRQQSTVDFLSQVPDRHLDVIYLDAGHYYEAVRDELCLAWHRVKPGGWISGHDYCDVFPGVIKAVTEFLELQKLKLEVLTDEEVGPVNFRESNLMTTAYNSFAFRKPK